MPFQLSIIANDRGIPPKTDSLRVDIVVNRDRFLPAFVDTYNVTIPETTSPNIVIETVAATDQDRRQVNACFLRLIY